MPLTTAHSHKSLTTAHTTQLAWRGWSKERERGTINSRSHGFEVMLKHFRPWERPSTRKWRWGDTRFLVGLRVPQYHADNVLLGKTMLKVFGSWWLMMLCRLVVPLSVETRRSRKNLEVEVRWRLVVVEDTEDWSEDTVDAWGPNNRSNVVAFILRLYTVFPRLSVALGKRPFGLTQLTGILPRFSLCCVFWDNASLSLSRKGATICWRFRQGYN